MAKFYKIVRFSFNGSKRTMIRGLSLEQAQAHCCDPQTSSRTCTTPRGKRTKTMIARHNQSPWFHGYVEEREIWAREHLNAGGWR